MTKARNLSDLLDANGIVDNAKITLDANEIPNLDASKIVSGDIASARLSLATETKPTVSSVSPNVITNDATNIVITGQDFTAIPRVDIINTATGIWYSVNTVTYNSATQLTVNLTLAVDAGTYRIRVENPDGLAGLSSANFLTVSDLPTWSTGAGSLGTKAGDFSGTVATVSASGDTIRYTETTNVLTNASLANCALDNVTGAITTTDFDGSSTSARTHTFTIRATDAQGQTTDREFSLSSSYFTSATVSYLVIAGGGGGGGDGETVGGAGGGAGGYRNSYASETSGQGSSTETPLTFNLGTTYTAIVGAGGTGHTSRTNNGSNGGNSSISGSDITDVVSIGGGKAAHTQGNAGFSGGSGGGGSYGQAGGAGTSNQGFAGGSASASGGSNSSGGAGGGAGSAGGNSSSGSAPNGGNGLTSSITGSAVGRAGGGAAGSSASYSQGSATSGGGAAGAAGGNNNGGNGTANTGGGGGGSSTSGNNHSNGGNGGSGIVILRMPTTAYNAKTGITGTYSTNTSGSDTVISFTAGTGTISF